jgi:Protein of unknown function (DUF3592)
MFTLPRKHVRSSDIPTESPYFEASQRRNSLLYLSVFLLLMLIYPALSEICEDLANEPVPAMVMDATLKEETIGGTQYFVPVVSYRYLVHGSKHDSKRMFGGGAQQTIADKDEASELLKPFQPGGNCIAYVSPIDPERALLKHFWDQPRTYLITYAVGLLLLIFCIRIAWNVSTINRANL